VKLQVVSNIFYAQEKMIFVCWGRDKPKRTVKIKALIFRLTALNPAISDACMVLESAFFNNVLPNPCLCSEISTAKRYSRGFSQSKKTEFYFVTIPKKKSLWNNSKGSKKSILPILLSCKYSPFCSSKNFRGIHFFRSCRRISKLSTMRYLKEIFISIHSR